MVLAASALILSACAYTTPKKAAQYNDMVMQHQREIVVKYDKMLESFDSYVGSKMDAAYEELNGQVAYTKYELGNMETPSGCEDLRDAVIRYSETYDEFLSEALPKLIAIYKRPENEFTPEMRLEWESTYKDMDSKLKEAGKVLSNAQANFAKEFNLKVSK